MRKCVTIEVYEEVIYKDISNDSNAVDGLRCADKWRVGGEDKYGMNMSE